MAALLRGTPHRAALTMPSRTETGDRARRHMQRLVGSYGDEKMLTWFTYLGVFLAKSYLGAFTLFIAGAPLLRLLGQASTPEWEDYFSSFAGLFRCLAGTETNYMWPFILLSFPIGFLVCELLFWFNVKVGLHDDLDITGDQEPEEHFRTTMFIQRHEHVLRVFHWESFQSNLFLCAEYTLELFLMSHLLVSLTITAVAMTPAKTFDPWGTILAAGVFFLGLLLYGVARYAREKKFEAFTKAYRAICKLKAEEEAKELAPSGAAVREMLEAIMKVLPRSSEPSEEPEEKP